MPTVVFDSNIINTVKRTVSIPTTDERMNSTLAMMVREFLMYQLFPFPYCGKVITYLLSKWLLIISEAINIIKLIIRLLISGEFLEQIGEQ